MLNSAGGVKGWQLAGAEFMVAGGFLLPHSGRPAAVVPLGARGRVGGTQE